MTLFLSAAGGKYCRMKECEELCAALQREHNVLAVALGADATDMAAVDAAFVQATELLGVPLPPHTHSPHSPCHPNVCRTPCALHRTTACTHRVSSRSHTSRVSLPVPMCIYELRVKIKDSLLVRMVVGATWSRATRLDTPPTCGNNPPFTDWS